MKVGLCRATPAGLAMLLWTGAQARADDALPCARFAKVLATGTIADRNALATRWAAEDPAAVAGACGGELRRAYLDPLRAALPAPSMPARRMENQWLAAYLQRLPAAEGPAWVPYLDLEAVDRADLERLSAHWAAGPTTAVPGVFRLAARAKDPAFKNEALHIVAPKLLALEAQDVTTATHLGASLTELGYGFLLQDAVAATVWALHQPGAPAAATAAELRLAAGDLRGAFDAYAAAARDDKRFLVHAALVADRLFAAQQLEPAALIPLGIQYRRCGDAYAVIWGFGSLRTAADAADPELRAEALRNFAPACPAGDDEDEDLDETDELAQAYGALERRYGATRAGARLRLAFLENLAAKADYHTTHGRPILGNELRAWIYPHLARPETFAFLGGAGRARTLRERVAGYLALPPEPDVYLNDPRH